MVEKLPECGTCCRPRSTAAHGSNADSGKPTKGRVHELTPEVIENSGMTWPIGRPAELARTPSNATLAA